ncbi:MAG TPA: adenosylcobinamide-GDP ribazoletransferase [Steroidobacteraceae bacterium]
MKRQLSLFFVAVQFLTRMPVPRFEGFEPNWLSQSARYFPLVGTLVGWIGVGVWWLSSLCFPRAIAVGLMISVTVLVTGAFHEDGFADVCDGFGGGATRDAILAIMKDSRVGAYGAIGVTLILGMKWATLTALPRATFPAVVVGASMVSRWCATALIWRMDYVRNHPDAKSKPLADGLGTMDWLVSGLLGAIALLPLAFLLDFTADPPWWRACLAAVTIAFAATFFAGRYFIRHIGGYTGDCLGAVQQITELGIVLAALGVLAAH